MKIKTFRNLKHKEFKDGTQALKFFKNGYGVSVVRHSFSYGNEKGLYELAVLSGRAGRHGFDWDICYTTKITDDVIGYLTGHDVSAIMGAVQCLKKRK